MRSVRFALPSIALVMLLAIATKLGTWAWLSGSAYVPDFDDLKQLTASAECLAADPSWDFSSPTCDPLGRAYNYPMFWIQALEFLNVTSGDTKLLGAGLAIIAIGSITIIAFLARSAFGSWTSLGLFTLAALSPPIFLLIDRGNSDSVILGLTVLAVVLVIRGNSIAGAPIIAFSGFLKLFSFASGLMLVVQRRQRISSIAMLGAFFLVSMFFLRDQIPIISANTPRSANTSFGISVVPLRHEINIAPFMGYGRSIGLSAVALFILGAITVLLLLRISTLKRGFEDVSMALTKNTRASVLFLAGSGPVIMAALVGTSYDYRLTFLLLPLAAVLVVRSEAPVSATWAAVLILVLMLGSGGYVWMGQIVDYLWIVILPMGVLFTAKIALNHLRNAETHSVAVHA